MSELQAILARRRQLNNDGGSATQPPSQPQMRQPSPQDPPADDNGGTVADVEPKKAASQPTQTASMTSGAANTNTFQRSQQKTTTSPGATDLQEKLRERRLKAMQTFGKHVKNDFKHAPTNQQEDAHGNTPDNHADTNSYTRQQSVPPRKSTFFPRSTPHVAPSKSPGDSLKVQKDPVSKSPGNTSVANVAVAETIILPSKSTALPSASTGHNSRKPFSSGPLKPPGDSSKGQQNPLPKSPGNTSDTNYDVNCHAGQETEAKIFRAKATSIGHKSLTPSSPGALPSRKQPQQQPPPPPPPPPKTIDNESPNSPSMLDFMAERYKNEKMKRHQNDETQPHNTDTTTTVTTSSSTQLEKKKSSTPTYYRPGMRPPSSSIPSRHNWIPPSPEDDTTPASPVAKLPPSPNRFPSLSPNNRQSDTTPTETNKKDRQPPPSSTLSSYIRDNENDNAPSEASVVDGSVFSDSSSTNNVPEFMRMKLKKTAPKRGDEEENKSDGGVGVFVGSGVVTAKSSDGVVTAKSSSVGGGVVSAKSSDITAKSSEVTTKINRGGVFASKSVGGDVVSAKSKGGGMVSVQSGSGGRFITSKSGGGGVGVGVGLGVFIAQSTGDDVNTAKNSGRGVISAKSGGDSVISAKSGGGDGGRGVFSAQSSGGDVITAKSSDRGIISAKSGGDSVIAANSGDGGGVFSAQGSGDDIITAKNKGRGIISAKSGGDSVIAAKSGGGGGGVFSAQSSGDDIITAKNKGRGVISAKSGGAGGVITARSAGDGGGGVFSAQNSGGDVITAKCSGRGIISAKSGGGGVISAQSGGAGGVITAKSLGGSSGGVLSTKRSGGDVVTAKSRDGDINTAKSSGGDVITAKRDGDKVCEKDAAKSKEPTATIPLPPVLRRWRPPVKTNDNDVSSRGSDIVVPDRNGPPSHGASWIQQRQLRLLHEIEEQRGVTGFARGQGRQQHQEDEEKIHNISKVKRMNQPQDHLSRGRTVLPPPSLEEELVINEKADEDSENEQMVERGNDSESRSTFKIEQPETTREDADEIAKEPSNTSTMLPLFANYNTAVLAAKEAIDASNRSRGRNSSKPTSQHMELSEKQAIAEDPELTMELSPESIKDIVFFDEDEQPPSNADANTNASYSNECNIFDAKEYDFAHDTNGIQLNSAIFGSSFVKSSLDMFANSDEEKENTDVAAETLQGHDDFGFDSIPFFVSDPFDPFFDGSMENDKTERGSYGGDMESEHTDKIGQIANFLGRTSTEQILMASWSEESPRFDAQFQDDPDAIDDQEENVAKSDHESPHHADKLTVESVDEPMPQPRRDAVDESILQSRHLDRRYEETGALGTAQNLVDQVITSTVDPWEVSGDENHTIEAQLIPNEEDEYIKGHEIVFDDSFGTFRMHPLEISFGPPCDSRRIPHPTQNPLTDNLIVCRCQNGDFVIEEIDVTQKRSPTTLMSVRVLSNESITKISRSIGASRHVKVVGVSSVLSLAAGVHRVHGHMRVRVAALTEVVVSAGVAGVKRVRVVAVWKWGYNPGGRVLVSLQSVLSTSGIDGGTFMYDPQTLQVADGLLFLGGHEIVQGTTEPIVFVAKPAVRDGWVSVCIGDIPGRVQSTGKTSSVSTLAAINDTNTFLAIGLTDGTVSIWTYDRAVRTNRISAQIRGKERENQSSLLQLLCRMNGEIDVASLSDYECLWKNDEFSSAGRSSLSENWDERSLCLSWIQPCSSGIASLPLLAVAFRSGVAVYHVSTNQHDVSSSESIKHQHEGTSEARSLLSYSSVDIIAPLAKAKYSTSTNSASLAKVTWFDLGPRSPPCLSIFLNETSTSKLNLCVIDIPWYGSTEIISLKSSPSHRSMGVLSQLTLDHIKDDACIVSLSRLGAIGCYHAGRLCAYQPILSSCSNNAGITSPFMVDGYFSSLHRPVCSASLGLHTDGSVYSDKRPNLVRSVYQDTVLTVFSMNTCSKIRVSNASKMQNWTIPSQRNWLLISAPGDRPIGSLVQDETDDNFDISYQRNAERSGAVSDVVCELTCGENPVSGLIPERIVREDGGRRVAVLFLSSYFGNNATDAQSRPRRRTHTRASTDPVAYAILDIDEIMKNRSSSSFTLRHARDVAFLPTSQMEGGFYCSSLVVLDSDGSGLSVTTVICSRSQKDGITEKVIESEDKCLLHYEGIEGRRVFTLLNGDHPQLLLAGESTVVGRPCLIVAQHELERDAYSNTFALIEADSLGHRLWLKTGEEVICVRELPKHPEAVHAHIAVATQQRVMIVTAEGSLSIVAEVNACLTSPSLSPLGSHCVAFSASSTPFSGGESCIMYLSCLHGVHGHGVILSLPTQRSGPYNILLTALRPDRLVYFVSHGGVRLTHEDGDAEDKFDIPIPITRPILLLEPLLANALCQDRACGANALKNDMVQQSLRLVIEKFGRKHTSFPHGDNEGIGSVGVGITSKAYNMLVQHECHQAALLLRGNGQWMTTQMRLMSPWVSMMSTLMPASDTEVSISPKPNNPSVMHTEKLAYSVAESESFVDVIRMLNLASSQSSEDVLRQLMLSLNAQSFPGAQSLLLNNSAVAIGTSNYDELLSLVTWRLANGAEKVGKLNVSQLAPDAQISWPKPSHRRVIDTDILEASSTEKRTTLKVNYSIKEGRHVWCIGPFGRPEKLFRLESFEDWFGRCLPTVLGNEGVALAAGTGEQTLANILSAAALEEAAEQPTIVLEHEHDSLTDRRKNWVEGVGEEHLDEDNLSLYIRFSEGADEDNKWKFDGFSDLSNHGHKLHLYGSEFATLEATTSSVDEGEQGKVQLLYDLVFNEGAPRDVATGVLVHVVRGSSLDIGMLHTPKNKSRQKSTIEFWYHLPQSHLLNGEIILARRSLFYEDSGDASTVCLPDEKHNTLWELALLPTGLLELRTGAGSVVTSAPSLDGGEENASSGIVSWEREDGGGGWNHVCLLFSAQSKSSPTEFSASILMNGVKVVSSASLFVNPLEAKLLRAINESDLEDAMERSVLVFGIGPSQGFRITDIRVWACLREEEDIKLMMYEHLRHAEMKKKLKVNIRNGPKKSVLPALPTLPFSQADNRRSSPMNPPNNTSQCRQDEAAFGSDGFLPDFTNFAWSEASDRTNDKVGESSSTSNPVPLLTQHKEPITTHSRKTDPPADPSFVVTISDLLSTKVRKSASSAIMRGPPAARHFGGNRGGLLCSHKRQGVGPIAICGSDKSIVFYHDIDPPAKTYPIGASGAILSDKIDETQSEYMCCFLAKEKRMVVFELALKAVVVELQMKTKLNFWRYLPPEADGGVLIFMLITPIGGFHWKPLDDSPRPRQVWKRGSELESKKILAYEEGGTCGREKSVRSTVALILASEATSGAAVEAYCISMDNESCRLCISPNVLGAALYQHPMPVLGRFIPYVVYVLEDEACQFHLNLQELHEEKNMFNDVTLVLGDVEDSVLLDVHDVSFDAPPLSMGSSPEALCCCHDNFIVAIMRKQGLAFAYNFTCGNLSLVGRIMLGHYVVDAAIRSGNSDNEVELVILLCDSDDSKDGRVAIVTIS